MFDKNALSGKTAFVTGASSGLGRHFAGVLARHGADVVVAARRLDALEALCEELRSAGVGAAAVPLDVTDVGSAREAAERAANAFGRPVDVVVNNAGVASTGKALDIEEADWDTIQDTNLKGAFFVAQAFARQMRDGGGSIVNIASILGLRVASQVTGYAVSKAGLVQMTKALALELARFSIRVNAICPGYIETDLNREFLASEQGRTIRDRIPDRRFGEMGDLDGALLLLASDASRYMTGSIIAVDGGHLVSSL